MTYKETTEYLFTRTPLFQNTGKDAYKEGLTTTYKLDEHFKHPHEKYHTIHVAGTNGKGSCSHTLASVLQEAGYRVGLFTSPHLVDFRERIRVDGKMIPEEYVTKFVEDERRFFEPLYPSFFELTTAMAFKFFADEKVDIAVVEVGLGGRLDCTNIIKPLLSLITNISLDHTQLLGDTLAKIAYEKAGIIKHDIPVVVGEATEETRPVFERKADEVGTEIIFAEDEPEVNSCTQCENGGLDYITNHYRLIHGDLSGAYQSKNTNTILTALKKLQHLNESRLVSTTEKMCAKLQKEACRCDIISITTEHIQKGFANVCRNTGLLGRWQQISREPLIVCDTGHNVGGFRYLVDQITAQKCKTLRIVFGMVNDKDVNGVLSMLPKQAEYYFCQASVKRALNHAELKAIAKEHGLRGESYPTVAEAYEDAKAKSGKEDFIYVGGSSFVVADLLSYIR